MRNCGACTFLRKFVCRRDGQSARSAAFWHLRILPDATTGFISDEIPLCSAPHPFFSASVRRKCDAPRVPPLAVPTQDWHTKPPPSLCTWQGSTSTKSNDLNSRASQQTLRAVCTLIPEKDDVDLHAQTPVENGSIPTRCTSTPQAPTRIRPANALFGTREHIPRRIKLGKRLLEIAFSANAGRARSGLASLRLAEQKPWGSGPSCYNVRVSL